MLHAIIPLDSPLTKSRVSFSHVLIVICALVIFKTVSTDYLGKNDKELKNIQTALPSSNRKGNGNPINKQNKEITV